MLGMGSVNNEELKAFKKIVDEQIKELDAFYEACAKELAARLLAKVIPRTPVGDYQKDNIADTYKRANKKKGIKKGDVKRDKKGNIKRSKYKMVSFETASGKRVSFKALSDKKGGTLRRGWTANSHKEAENGSGRNAKEYANSLKVIKKGGVYELTVSNPVNYAVYVENGHRTRGGKGWVPGQFFLRISENLSLIHISEPTRPY